MVFPIAFLLLALQSAQPLSGAAVANDGDSLTIGGTRIRLYGIDAPELGQTCERDGARWACGKSAADELAKLVQGHTIQCSPMSTDGFGRTVARCSADGVELNRTMVALGYAVAFRRYSMDYISAEETAHSNQRGIWSGSFEMPADVRAAERGGGSAPQVRAEGNGRVRPVSIMRLRRGVVISGTSGCRIKGNHSRRGELIYHLPGHPYYNETRAEQMFCSEAEARAAGYRASRAY